MALVQTLISLPDLIFVPSHGRSFNFAPNLSVVQGLTQSQIFSQIVIWVRNLTVARMDGFGNLAVPSDRVPVAHSVRLLRPG